MSKLVLGDDSELPKSWTSAALEDVATLSPKFSDSDVDITDSVHFVPMASVAEDFGGIDVSRLRPYGEVRKGYTYFAEGDVLFAKITPCMENGKGALVPHLPQKHAFGSTEFHVLRSQGSAQPKWLAHYLSQPDFRRVARQHMSGTAGQLRVPTKWLAAARIPLAPLAEQTRIVEKLEELVSDLDTGVAELKAAQRKLAQYRQSLLKAAVEGALTADWRAARANSTAPQETGAELLQRILTERRARWEAKQLAKFAEQGKAPPKDWQGKYKEPGGAEPSDLPALPKGWAWASAEQLCEFITKGTTPPSRNGDDTNNTVPFLRVTNLTDNGSLNFSDRVFVSPETHIGFLARSIVYPRDVLMNIVGPPLGQVSVVPSNFAQWNINQAIAIFRAVDGVLPDFICTVLLSAVAQRWLKARAKTTAGQTNLTLELCRNLPVPLPPMAEQLKLVDAMEAAMQGEKEQAEVITHALKQSAAQRKNILKAAFAGQLVPQDPNDEPASTLLERIRIAKVEYACKAKPVVARGRRA